jgi:hypothetical protein
MKYVMLKKVVDGREHRFPIIFPNTLSHDEVAAIAKCLPDVEDADVVSAGECLVQAACSGRSVTLNISSRDDDSFLVSNADYINGMNEDEIALLPPSVLKVMNGVSSD